MSPEAKKKFNTVFGAGFIAAGLMSWMIAAYFAYTPKEPIKLETATAAPIDLNSCRNALGSMGYETQLKDNLITAYEALSSDDVKRQLEKASLGVAVCKLPLESFCAGEGCERLGLSFTLKGEKPTPKSESAKDKGAKSAPPSKQ